MNKTNTPKNKKIINLRVIAIILVVLAHSIIIYNPTWGIYTTKTQSPFLKYLCTFIYIFHMPLYFSISGFLYKNVELSKETFFNMCKKKTIRLLVPFILVGLFWLLPVKYSIKYPNYISNSLAYNIINNLILGKDNGHLWFLPALFLIFVLYYFLSNFVKKKI